MPTRLLSLNRVSLLAISLFASFALSTQAAEGSTPPDSIPTDDGALRVHPINHATFALEWKSAVVYVDPVGGKKAFAGLPAPGLILITDIHGDHLHTETLEAVAGEKTRIIAPPAVVAQLPAALRERTTVLSNGQSHAWSEIKVEAVPAYNVTPERLKFHAKGRGNGYLLTLGGKRVYISGDTEPTPEMLALKNIDVAFLCMNLPYTMDVSQAAEAIKNFKPRIVYPYHSRGSDLEKLQSLVGKEAGVEIRVRDWYSSR